MVKFPHEIEHEALIRHEVYHALTSALLSGVASSIVVKADGNGYGYSALPESLQSRTQVELCRVHLAMAGSADAFTTTDGLCGRYPVGSVKDGALARESAVWLRQQPMFHGFDVKGLVDLAGAMSAYLVLDRYRDLAAAMVGRLSTKSWETRWSASDIEAFLLMEPSYKHHTPLLVGEDWPVNWCTWAQHTVSWLEAKHSGPQQSYERRYGQLLASIAARS